MGAAEVNEWVMENAGMVTIGLVIFAGVAIFTLLRALFAIEARLAAISRQVAALPEQIKPMADEATSALVSELQEQSRWSRERR